MILNTRSLNKIIRERLSRLEAQVSSACPGDDPEEVECECQTGVIPSSRGSGVTFDITFTLAELMMSRVSEEGGDEENSLTRKFKLPFDP